MLNFYFINILIFLKLYFFYSFRSGEELEEDPSIVSAAVGASVATITTTTIPAGAVTVLVHHPLPETPGTPNPQVTQQHPQPPAPSELPPVATLT